MKKLLLLCAIISLSLGDCKLISQKTDRITDAVISNVECSSNGNKILFELSKIGSENNIKFNEEYAVILGDKEAPAYVPKIPTSRYADIRIDKNKLIVCYSITEITGRKIFLMTANHQDVEVLNKQLNNNPNIILIQYGAVFGDDYKKHIIEFDISSLKNFY